MMASTQETIHFLAKVPLFRNLKKRQLEALVRQVATQDYEAGQEIVTQGKGGAGLFIVASGSAQAIHMRPDGTKAMVNVFESTDFFGELALLSEGPRTATVIATEPTQCLILTRWNFLSVLRNDADMAISILEEIADRFRITLGVL